MTIEEAIKDIKENIQPSVGGKSLEMAIDALEKQIPKEMESYYCPICRHYFEDGEEHNYCPSCGQRLTI